MPRPALQRYLGLAALLLLALLGLYLGWRVCWFLTDDAYIAFRYISNSRLGYGYVWNPPPFKPVEGYTSFLWVFLLDVAWRLTGLDPTRASNPISLAFALGTLLLAAALLWRLRLSPALDRWRLALLALVLSGILSNRTFLAWTSSGLETAMFNFWLTAWVFVAVSLPPGSPQWWAGWSALAALMALTRPDGLLFCAATGLLWAWEAVAARRPLRLWPRALLPLAPLLLVPLHLGWRFLTYNAWLPNTYVAKDTGPWPESGWRYLLSFILEYSWWFWLALALAALVVALRQSYEQGKPAQAGFVPSLQRFLTAGVSPRRALRGRGHAPPALALLTLAAHFAYYTLLIGGDHFEYRVYSHLVPLLWVSSVWLLNFLAARPPLALGLTALALAASLPIPWAHWALSQRYVTRPDTLALRVPVAPAFPAPLQPYVAVFDSLQAWLIERAVLIRHQEHKVFLEYQLSTLPPREVGLLLSPRVEAVRMEGAVGAIGWVLPTVAIIDRHGLNDLAIARNPLDPARPRVMAHDRLPPEGYLECFAPNTLAPIHKLIVAQRAEPLRTLVPRCENTAWPVGRWHGEIVGLNQGLVPPAARVLDNIWMPDPIFAYYVPPGLSPLQPLDALWSAFRTAYHDTGCLVYPPPAAADGYAFAFLPANLRYSPDELRTLFPWAGLVDFERTGAPRPYTLAYALPAAGAAPPAPLTTHPVEWAPASLLGYTLASSDLAPGSSVEIELHFRLNGPAPAEQWFQLRLAPDGQPDTILASDQGDPCRGLYPAWLWEAGQDIVAKAFLYLPPDLAPGGYSLRIEMFDLGIGPGAMLDAMGDQTLLRVQIGAP